MKRILFVVLLASCSNSHNDKMNNYLLEKKQTETKIDSLMKESKNENALSYSKDTSEQSKHMKLSFNAELQAREEKEKLQAINYSIDSLSKLK